jgi:putative glutamine transport system permease protein
MTMGFFAPYTFGQVLAFLLQGLGVTLIIALISIVLSFLFGSLLGILRFLGKGFWGKLAGAYIDIVRNIPVLLFIISFRLLLPTYIGSFKIPNKALVSAILAMTVFTSAMVAEIVRGGLNGVPHGQWEAARSQGFTLWQTLRYIILPQAVKHIFIPMMGQFVSCLKDTSLCQVLGVGELMLNATIIIGKYRYASQVILIYSLVAGIYCLVNVLLLKAARRIQSRTT